MFRPASRILYLHGFASSPNSRKAVFFAEKLNAEGRSMEALDLAQGDFAGLTVTGQLSVIEQAARGEPVILIGSSLGSYLAALYAARHPEVRRLVLLAPAFCFAQLWEKELGTVKLAEWRKKGTIPIFHYGEGRQMNLGYKLMEDARNSEPYPAFPQPCLIFHGSQDSVVPVGLSEVFAGAHSNVRLITLQSGHELTDVLDEIWEEAKPFLTGGTSDNVKRRENSTPIGA